MKYTVNYKGKEVEVTCLPNKKFRKPNISQFTKQGLGAAWLDDCRIPYVSNTDMNFRKNDVAYRIENGIPPTKSNINNGVGAFVNANSNGRFPANVLCEDNVLDDGIERKSGAVLTHYKRSGNSNLGETFKIRNRTGEFADWKSNSGEFSRFFSLDAWFAERIKLLPKEAQKTFPWLIVPKASKSEKDRGCEDLEGVLHFPSNNESGNMLSSGDNKPQKTKGNFHPTCKPIKLMSWLITLASREGDIVLDPFCGSGATAIAAKMLSRQYIGIEREEEYCKIARKRLSIIPQRLDSYNIAE